MQLKFKNNENSHRYFSLFIALNMFLIASPLMAAINVEGDLSFKNNVLRELKFMREGKRGIVCQVLADRLDSSVSSTTIRPLTMEEETWHPNDRKGTRSYVVALDTKIRGAERSTPTGAVIYLHPNRIDPNLSLFRLGTFVYELASACDLNYGLFPRDFKIREKRAVFFRNAWCDAMGYNLIEMSGRIPTPEYKNAKASGLLTSDNSAHFPILNIPLEGVHQDEPEDLGQ